MIYKALAISVVNAAGRSAQLLAFVLIGRVFGAGSETDAVFLYAVPLYVLIAVGAGVGEIVLIPGLRSLDEISWRRARNALLPLMAIASLLAALVVIAVLSIFMHPPSATACGFLLLMVMAGNVAAFLNAVLHARSRHFMAVSAPLFGGALAVAVLLLVSRNAAGLAATLFCFEAGRVCYLVLAARNRRNAGHAQPSANKFLLGELLRNGRYQLVASLAIALNPVVDILFARTLGAGALTSLEYASRLWNAVPLVFSGALILLHVRWADAHRLGDDMIRRARSTALLLGAAAVPVTAALIYMVPWLTALLYGNAKMTPLDIERVSDSLVAYLPGAVPFVAGLVLVRAFSATGKVRNIALVSLSSVPLNIALNALLVGPLGLVGLALATSLVYTVNFIGLWYLLGKD